MASKFHSPFPVLLISTLDTKGAEMEFIADAVAASGGTPLLVDVATGPNGGTYQCQYHTFTPTDVLGEKIGEWNALGDDAKTDKILLMSAALEIFVKGQYEGGQMKGMLGMGGSGGTSVITPAMRHSVPVGFPKLMVSTVASGNVRQYVGCSDITMMYSVVDECGINSVSAQIFTNAGYAISGMAKAPRIPPPTYLQHGGGTKPKPSAAMTMFGVTTTCVNHIEKKLSAADKDCLVFHCTGAGGEGMEQLICDGAISSILDITTTELCDLIAGQIHGTSCQGVMSAGADRMRAVVDAKIPTVISVGALDMINYNGIASVPDKFTTGSDRILFVHNAGVTLMRTNVEENVAMATHMVQQLQRAETDIVLLLPTGGVSVLDQEIGVGFYGATFDNWQKINQGGDPVTLKAPWHDAATNEALFGTLREGLEGVSHVTIVDVPHNLNTTEFAEVAIERLYSLYPPVGR